MMGVIRQALFAPRNRASLLEALTSGLPHTSFLLQYPRKAIA